MQKPLASNKQNPQKAKTKKEMAEDLGISLSTLRRHLQKAGLPARRGLYYADEQALIYESLGSKLLTRNDSKWCEITRKNWRRCIDLCDNFVIRVFHRFDLPPNESLHGCTQTFALYIPISTAHSYCYLLPSIQPRGACILVLILSMRTIDFLCPHYLPAIPSICLI